MSLFPCKESNLCIVNRYMLKVSCAHGGKWSVFVCVNISMQVSSWSETVKQNSPEFKHTLVLCVNWISSSAL